MALPVDETGGSLVGSTPRCRLRHSVSLLVGEMKRVKNLDYETRTKKMKERNRKQT